MPRYAQSSARVIDSIRALKPFDTYGNMSATNDPYYAGYLRGSALEAWNADRPAIDYAVYSYGTPIAWHTPEGGWTYVDRSFSISTSRVQSYVKQALGIYLYGPEARTNGVRVLQRHYYVTPRQSSFLWSLQHDPIVATGGEISTARALARKGLVTYDEATRTATLTPAGRDQL